MTRLKVHPIRATLAISGWLATIAMLFVGTDIPDAWWGALGSVTTFYFMGSGES